MASFRQAQLFVEMIQHYDPVYSAPDKRPVAAETTAPEAPQTAEKLPALGKNAAS
jgi:hypothetical protein